MVKKKVKKNGKKMLQLNESLKSSWINFFFKEINNKEGKEATARLNYQVRDHRK